MALDCTYFYALATDRCGSIFKDIIFKFILQIDIMSINCVYCFRVNATKPLWLEVWIG